MNEDKWVIIGRPECTYCEKIWDYFEGKEIEFTYFNVREELSIRDFLRASGLTTVPQVFLNGFLIGGCDDTMKYIEKFYSPEFANG